MRKQILTITLMLGHCPPPPFMLSMPTVRNLCIYDNRTKQI